MHQNMNHYYDQQVINTSLIIEPCKSSHDPRSVVMINGNILFEGVLDKITTLHHESDLLDTIDISVELRDKNYKQSSDSGIIINSLTIDEFDVIPNWTHLAKYENDHNYSEPTNHLGFNGTWRLKISEPFYRWHHRVAGQGWLLEP